MHELLGWNLNLGRIFGVRVRVHAVFVLLVVVSVGWSLRTAGDDLAGPIAFWLLLALSVLAHEGGHSVAALRVGGCHDEWLLWPLGGLTQPRLPPDPAAHCLVALAGPLANLVVFLTAALVLLVGGLVAVEDLSPFSLPYELPLDVVGVIRMLAWINGWLLLINLLPAFPLDGGPALRAALSVGYGSARAGVLARWVSVAVGLGLCLAALVVPHELHFQWAWLAPILLGLVVLLGAVRESAPFGRRRRDDADWPPGQDLSRRPPYRAASPSRAFLARRANQVPRLVERSAGLRATGTCAVGAAGGRRLLAGRAATGLVRFARGGARCRAGRWADSAPARHIGHGRRRSRRGPPAR